MKIFINDTPVNLLGSKLLEDKRHFNVTLDGKSVKISPKMLVDDVLIINASPKKVEELLQVMTDKKLKNLNSVTFVSDRKKELVAYIKDKFKIIEAGGGVVQKDDRMLLIHRLGKWDLPKGKLDKGEKISECALREVEEETLVKCLLGPKICHTWHTYTRNKKYVLKKTSWYAMECLDDSKMSPQTEEDIDEVRWMDLREMREALYDSYRTIRFVVSEYHRQLKGGQGVD